MSTKKKSRGGGKPSSEKEAGNGVAEKADAEEVPSDGGEGREETAEGGRRGGLRAFVKEMDGRSHRMVEMRLGLVGACGVAFRVLLYDDLTGREDVVWSVLSLICGQFDS